MRPIFLLCLLPFTLFGAANDSIQTQRNSADNGTVTRVVTIPTGGQDGIFTFDGASILPKIWTFSNGIVRNGSDVQTNFTGLSLGDIHLIVPYSGVTGTPSLATVATTGSYLNLINRPTFALVATSGLYSDLSGTPTIPAAQVNSDWTASSGVSSILNKPSLSTVAITGAYSDLTGKPSIPSAQVNSDWNAVSGISQILNKPTLGTAAAQNTSAFATATQGSTADSALQPAGNGSSLTGLTQSQISGLTSALAGKYPNPTGTTLQYIRGDGTLATLPASDSGTVTSVGLSSTDFTVSGSPVTVSGSITANLNASGVTAGTYNSVTVNSKGIVTAATNISVNNTPSRAIVAANNVANGFQISSTRNCLASYSITITASATGLVAGASSGYVVLELCPTNSATPTDWTEVGRWTNGQTFTSVLTLTSSQPVGADVSKIIPAGYYVRIRSVNVSGTPTYTINSGQEVLL